MTSEQAAQLIDSTLDLVHQRLISLGPRSKPRPTGPLRKSSASGAIPAGAASI